MSAIAWTPHSDKQETAVWSQAAITAILTGVQWGKTESGAVRMKVAIHTFTDPSDNFLVVAPTYKILQQSTLPAFLKVMAGCGEYSKVDAVFTTLWGTRVYFRTGTDPDSIVGITNIRHIWADEAGILSLYFWENLQARAAFREAAITLTSSPYTLNWLFKEIVLPKMKDPNARPDVALIQAASWESPFMRPAVIDRARVTMDARRFAMMFGGEWGDVIGRVYDCFDEVENQCQPFTLPTGTRFVGGIDWGHTHAFVFKVRAITPDGAHFGVHEFYKTGLTISDIVGVVKRVCAVYGVGLVYCAPERPENILELCRNGIKAVPADNSVRLGIDRHYELLKTRRLKFFIGANPYTLDELSTYHYAAPEELRPDQNAKDRDPVKQNDDCVDCDRYISIMTFLSDQKSQPYVPAERQAKVDHAVETERLKRRPRGGGSEEWS